MMATSVPIEFERWMELLRERAGLSTRATLRHRLQQAIVDGQRESKAISSLDYYQRVLNDAKEWSRLRDRLLNHETSFFRDQSAFALLQHELPQILETKWLRADRELRLASIGCSIGAEPYSLAMLLRESLPEPEAWEVRIAATDLGIMALQRTQEGWFRNTELRGLSDHRRQRFWVPEVREYEAGYRALPCLRDWIHCSKLDLIESEYALGLQDVIFCQNVLIYFDAAVRVAIVARMMENITPGGLLFLGPADAVGLTVPLAELVEFGDAVAYRRRI